MTNSVKLHSLKPKNIHDQLTEGGCSYIGRISLSHNVHPRILFSEGILPQTTKLYLQEGKSTVSKYLFSEAHQMMSTGSTASEICEILEELTGQHNLRNLTMLPWVNVLSSRGLMRNKRAWCPNCLFEMRKKEGEIYEPLLWAIRAVGICDLHDCKLQDKCPNPDCQAVQPFLPSSGRIGYCYKCGQALFEVQAKHEKLEDAAWKKFVVKNVGELIAKSPDLVEDSNREFFSRAILDILENTFDSNLSQFSKTVKVSRKTIGDWIEGTQIISMSSLLRLCAYLNISAFSLFTENDIYKKVRMSPLPFQIPSVSKKTRPNFDMKKIRGLLQAELRRAEPPYPSMTSVANEIGKDLTFLKSHFPNEVEIIIRRFEKYREQQKLARRQSIGDKVKNTVLELHSKGIYPSCNLVAQSLDNPNQIREVRIVWQSTLELLGYKTKIK